MKIPPPGRLVDRGRRKLHVCETGTHGPTVLFEAGIAATSLSWSLVQRRVSEFAKAVSYDRAGLGWSDPARHPATAGDAADDLAGLVSAARLSGPLILVGHSFGGLIARVLQQRHPELVSGMVLIDPVGRGEWVRPTKSLARGVKLSRRGALLARMGIVRLALRLLVGGSHSLPRLLARASAGRGAGVAERLTGEVRKMPRELWPAIAQHWGEASSFETMASALENLPVSVAQLDETRDLGDLPLVVLSAGTATPRARAEHENDAQRSSRGWHRVLPSAGHWIQLDDPDAVVDAIRSVAESL